MSTEHRLTVCEIAQRIAAPNEILVSPLGDVASASGDFTMDEFSARAIIVEFEQHGVDLPIDYEHQTLGEKFASPQGRAPAAGWIQTLFIRPGDGLYAKVLWTADAAEAIAKREYRYVSPVLLVEKESGRARRLHSVALTNMPAIVGMKPIVASRRFPTGDRRDQIIAQAAAEYDAEPKVHRLCSKTAYVNDACREAGLAAPSNTELQLLSNSQVIDGVHRSSVITAAGVEYDQNKYKLSKLTSRRAYVNESLREAGFELLPPEARGT
ncbi:MAG: phage protease [Phycisphaerae bacterium]